MRGFGWKAVALVCALVVFGAAPAFAGKLHVTCTDGVVAGFGDGAIACDTDGASDGVCTFSFCRGVDSAPRFCATVTCDVSATCFGFELKLKPKPGKPKPPKELKPKSLKADLRCVPPS